MYARFWLAIAAVCAACGDNSKACGPGTVDDQGSCVPAATNDGGNPCGPGTQLDPSTGLCTVAASACGGGTILLNGNCVDPTQQLTISLEEGPEPNGFGVFEASNGAAGAITLAPINDSNGFVIHGTLKPFRDDNGDGQYDPDFDTYTLAVSGPTLLHVTATGLDGIAGGFLVRAAVPSTDPLAPWQRFGMAVRDAIAKRQVFLPAAGNYTLTIADTRSLYEHSTGGPIAAAPGVGSYYVRIDQLVPVAPPTAAATQTANLGTDSEIAQYTIGAGQSDITLAVPAPQAVASLVVTNNGAVVAVANETASPAEVVATFTSTDSPVITVDDVYDTASDPVAYTLAVTTQ